MSRRGGSPVPDLNSGKEWSKMDLDDLRLFARTMSVEEMAEFLCRNRVETKAKAKELGIPLRWRPPGKKRQSRKAVL